MVLFICTTPLTATWQTISRLTTLKRGGARSAADGSDPVSVTAGRHRTYFLGDDATTASLAASGRYFTTRRPEARYVNTSGTSSSAATLAVTTTLPLAVRSATGASWHVSLHYGIALMADLESCVVG